MRVLLSAINCKPNSGSEEALGWSNLIGYAEQGYDVTLITSSYNRRDCESNELFKKYASNIHMVYIKFPDFLKKWKGRRDSRIRSMMWNAYFQKKAYEAALSLIKSGNSYAYCRHVSWASLIQKTYMYKLPIPFVLGPVGGGEVKPKKLEARYTIKENTKEKLREVIIFYATHRPYWYDMLRKTKLIFVTTEETKKLIPVRFQNKVIVQQGISIAKEEIKARIHKINSKNFKVIMSGRMLSWKGLDLGIEAICNVLNRGHDIELEIYGGGSEQKVAQLQKQCGKWLDSRIHFHGNVPKKDMLKAYEECDCLLNTSYHDSGCYVVLEAMAHELPIICVNTGGPKVLTDENSAIRIEPNKRIIMVSEIESALEKLIQNPEFGKSMGINARKRVESLWETNASMLNIQRIINLYVNK